MGGRHFVKVDEVDEVDEIAIQMKIHVIPCIGGGYAVFFSLKFNHPPYF